MRKFYDFIVEFGLPEMVNEKIVGYIETGDIVFKPTSLPSINMKDNKVFSYQKRNQMIEILEEFDKDDIKAKRAMEIILELGSLSLFRFIYDQYYSLFKAIDYLKDYVPGEALIIWLENLQNTKNTEEIIRCYELILDADRESFNRVYNYLEDDYSKVILMLFMVKNNLTLNNDQEKVIKGICSSEYVTGLIGSKLKLLSMLLYYASSSREEFKELFSEIINKHYKEITDELVNLIISLDSNVEIYDVILDFKIDKKLYISWLVKQYVFRKKDILAEVNTRIKEMPSVFRESLDVDWVKNSKIHVDGFVEIYLRYFLYINYKEDEDLAELKSITIKHLSNFILNELGRNEVKTPSDKLSLLKYLKGEKSLDDMGEGIKILKSIQSRGYIDEFFKKLFGVLHNIDKLKNITISFVNLFVKAEKYNLVSSLVEGIVDCNLLSYIDIMEELRNSGVSIDNLIIITDTYLNRYNLKSGEKAIEYLDYLINHEEQMLIDNIGNLSVNTKETVLEGLFNKNKEKYTDLLISYLGDSLKVIRNKVIELLGGYEDSKERVLKSLKSKKAVIRECAVMVLANFDMSSNREELEEALAIEKNEKVKNLIMNILNVEEMENIEITNGKEVSDYCKEKLQSLKIDLPDWIDLKTMPKVKFNNGDLVDDEVMRYIIFRYSTENSVALNEEIEKLLVHMDPYDLDKFGNEILKIWIDEKADTKKKWVLSLAAATGGFNVVNTLKTQIELWPQNSRGAIACEGVKALALLGSDEALIIIDSIARKFKFKQVKNAANLAFKFAAESLKVDYEELADKIVPNLGFKEYGEKIVDYGNRKFTVILERDFSLKVVDENGKVYKTLPKPNKSDDEILASKAQDEFKILKKQLKIVVSTQNNRLELALSVNRLWTKTNFEKLFVGNPIMHNFSLGLIWGIYNEGKLISTFRYMEEGTFNTVDEEDFEIPESALIGLVHPLEILEEEVEGWKIQLEDYEIEQPFLQLSRPVYKLNEEEVNAKSIERFGGKVIYGLSLVSKLSKYGWYRGSVQDAGSYYQLYKENKTIGIGAELTFDYLGIGWEDHDTTIYELTFYKSGSVERGSYVYDEVTDSNRIEPNKVPNRLFSEIMYDVDRVLEGSTGYNKNWKKG